jgi:Tfp pilus assembly protein PilZ
MPELRRHERKVITVQFKGTESSGVGELTFEAVDLSAGGTFLKADLLFEQGERLWLQFKVPGVPKMMYAEGRVRWVRRFPEAEEHGGMGVEFETITEDDRAVLTRYLARA